jgi:hypothetical protein
MVSECLEGNSEFGVVLIERGSEVGGGDVRASFGCMARIIGAGRLPDGRMLVDTIGTRRLEIETWLPDDPYPLALARERVDPAFDIVDTDRLQSTLEVVRGALQEALAAGEPVLHPDTEFDDEPAVAAWQLVAAAPISIVDRQRLLGIDTFAERLDTLAGMASQAAELFRFRIEGPGLGNDPSA